jgi:hypothetical protein
MLRLILFDGMVINIWSAGDKEMEYWSIGVMKERHGVIERWRNGLKKGFFNTPVLQYSSFFRSL